MMQILLMKEVKVQLDSSLACHNRQNRPISPGAAVGAIKLVNFRVLNSTG